MRGRRLISGEVPRRVALVVGGVLVPLLAGELLIHALEARQGPLFPGGPRVLSFSAPDPVLGWTHQADFSQRYRWPEHPDGHLTIATNNLGLREDAPTELRPALGAHRALVLGDSQTDGLLNNDEAWPNVLERLLTADPGPWEVLNAGVTGYRLWHYVAWWEEHGRLLSPDVVLLGYYLGNDLATGAPPTAGQVESETATSPIGVADVLGALIAPIRHRCRLCALVSLAAHRTFLSGPTFEESMFVGDPRDESQLRYLAALRECIGCLWQSVEQQWRLSGDAEYRKELGSTEALLRGLRDDVTRHGAELIVVILPSKLEIEPAAAEPARATARLLGMEDVDLELEPRLARDLRTIVERLGLRSIDVRQALLAAHARTGVRLYYDADWHLNVDGSRVVGESVARGLSLGGTR